MPPGWTVRIVMLIEGKDRFSERFELAGPGKDFACLITNQFSRKKFETSFVHEDEKGKITVKPVFVPVL